MKKLTNCAQALRGDLHPLSSRVVLSLMDDGTAYLTDGRRAWGPYASGLEAMDDADAYRRLFFGEDFPG